MKHITHDDVNNRNSLIVMVNLCTNNNKASQQWQLSTRWKSHWHTCIQLSKWHCNWA